MEGFLALLALLGAAINFWFWFMDFEGAGFLAPALWATAFALYALWVRHQQKRFSRDAVEQLLEMLRTRVR